MQGLCECSKAFTERETSELVIEGDYERRTYKVIEREQVFRVDKDLHGEFDPGSGRVERTTRIESFGRKCGKLVADG